jgi:hypothetical protein
LNVTSFSSLNCRIDKTLTTSHSVEEELLRSQSGQIAVLDESLASWPIIVLAEMR